MSSPRWRRGRSVPTTPSMPCRPASKPSTISSTRCPPSASSGPVRHADRLMAVPPAERGLLAGLPVPIKDLTDVAGVRTTSGSRLREDNVVERSDIVVETLEGNGAVVFAKSNTPEFGAGGNTFNDVFGATRNPHDLRLTAGGSSGGGGRRPWPPAWPGWPRARTWPARCAPRRASAASPACAPHRGRIASGPSVAPFLVHSQQGPMARDIADLALFADAMVGESPLAGLGKPPPVQPFRQAAAEPQPPARVAFSVDLGVTETSAEVAETLQSSDGRSRARRRRRGGRPPGPLRRCAGLRRPPGRCCSPPCWGTSSRRPVTC